MPNKEKQKKALKDWIRAEGGYQPEPLIGDHELIPPSTGSNVKPDKASILEKCRTAEQNFNKRGLHATVWYDVGESVYKYHDETGDWLSYDGTQWSREELKDCDKEPCEKGIDVRSFNVGESDYSKHKIQPWDIWIEYKLNPFDADIIKRVLRHKSTDSRRMDYEKIIHICQERIRQLDCGEDVWEE